MLSTASDFLLIDCNAFFVSCERVFNPALRAIPVVVLSSNDGCVVARSQEAKDIGIPMGAAYFQYKDLLQSHKGQALSSNFALYADMSRRVMDILHKFCKKVEVYSIDEAFVEISQDEDSLHYFLIDTIKKWTGIPVTIGRATSKTLAKLASDHAKKQKIPYLHLKKDIDPLLEKTAISDIWGIGKKLTKKLNSLHIITAFDLKNTPGFLLKKHTSILVQKTALELSGLSCLSLLEYQDTKKSITYARSFGKSQTSFEAVYAALSFYVQKASLKLRHENALCSQIIVFLETSRFDKDPYTNYGSLTLPIPSQDTPWLIQNAGLILKKIFLPGCLYKKVGIILLDLIQTHEVTEDLFIKTEEKREKALSVFDQINQKYGSRKLEYASARMSDDFQRLSKNQSPSFTASWDQLLSID